MKFLATFFCLYFFTLTATPTVRVVKMYFAQNCQSSCQKNKPSKSELPSGCTKEKCVLNFNFTPSQFLVVKLHYDFVRNVFEIDKKGITSFQKRMIANHDDVIWHPPEILS